VWLVIAIPAPRHRVRESEEFVRFERLNVRVTRDNVKQPAMAPRFVWQRLDSIGIRAILPVLGEIEIARRIGPVIRHIQRRRQPNLPKIAGALGQVRRLLGPR